MASMLKRFNFNIGVKSGFFQGYQNGRHNVSSEHIGNQSNLKLGHHFGQGPKFGCSFCPFIFYQKAVVAQVEYLWPIWFIWQLGHGQMFDGC